MSIEQLENTSLNNMEISNVVEADVDGLNESMKICSADNSMVENMIMCSPEDPKNRFTNLIDFEGSNQGQGEEIIAKETQQKSMLGMLHLFEIIIVTFTFYLRY